MWRVYSVHNWMFILHRLTGVGLLLYFVAHVITISTAFFAGPQAFTSVMGAFRQPGFRSVELLVVGCVLFHGLNGLHMIAAERGWLRTEAKPAFARATVAATLCIWAMAGILAIGH